MSSNIYDLLRGRYPAPEWAMFHEVNTGYGYGDAVVINMWGSRGYAVHGFELKSSRGDWLRELKQPKKAEALHSYCDFWWLLTGSKEIVKESEIPVGWGWVSANGERLKTMIEAPKLKPKALDRKFIAAVLRRSHEMMCKMIHPNEIKDKIVKARQEGEEIGMRQSKAKINQLQEIVDDVNEFEKASGIIIHNKWNYSHDPAKLGAALKFIMDGGVEKSKENLLKLKETSDRISKYLNEQLNIYENNLINDNAIII